MTHADPIPVKPEDQFAAVPPPAKSDPAVALQLRHAIDGLHEISIRLDLKDRQWLGCALFFLRGILNRISPT